MVSNFAHQGFDLWASDELWLFEVDHGEGKLLRIQVALEAHYWVQGVVHNFMEPFRGLSKSAHVLRTFLISKMLNNHEPKLNGEGRWWG